MEAWTFPWGVGAWKKKGRWKRGRGPRCSVLHWTTAALKLYFEEHFKIITLFSFKTEVNCNVGSGTSFAIGLIKNLYWGESDALASWAASTQNIKFISQVFDFMAAGGLVVRPAWVYFPVLPLIGYKASCKLLLFLESHMKGSWYWPHRNAWGWNYLIEARESGIAAFSTNVYWMGV